MKKILTLFFALTFVGCASAIQQDYNAQSVEELKEAIESEHPAAYYILASKLMEKGKHDDAVFWFYVGQLRYRFHLGVNEGKLDPSGDPALFSSFSYVIGTPVNEYAFGDLDTLAKTFDRVIEWDATNPNGFTSKTVHKKEHEETVEGLRKLKFMIIEQADDIRKSRLEAGLENRS